ncbi:MAG: S8 family serine peptidase [Bacteroidaceae bacterium]|nr:S8 family serine peptidase [Bacteroidaceae bacterium]
MRSNYLSRIIFSLFLGVMAMPTFSQVSNDNEDEVNKVDHRSAHDYVPGQVLVKMKDGSPANVQRVKGKFKSAGIGQLDAVLREFGVEGMEQLLPHEKPGRTLRKAKAFNGDVIQERDLSQLYLLQMNAEKAMETQQLIERLSALPEVEFAEPNYKAYITADANSFGYEPLFSQLWGLSAINMPQLWGVKKISQKRPVIAILDTGIDIAHPDLAANVWTNAAEAEGEEGYDNDNNGFKNDIHGWDFINQTGTIRDFNGHGTHCAGIAAAIGDNRLGVVGANPDALIMPITIMQSDGTGDLATIIRGIDYAIAMGADVLSMSIGTYATSLAFEQALGRAYQNAILVAAAGNDGYCLNHDHPERGQKEPMPMFPAAYNFVLGVQASAASGAMAGFSNYDDNGAFFTDWGEDKLYNYELRAPGASIMSIWPGGKYRSLNGTSMACPLVAGALSRLIQCKEIGSKEELFGDLIHSTTRVGDLDIYKAYQWNDTNRRPSLSFVTYTIDDSDGDGRLDAGETIAIYPTLRNDWGTAANIQISIEPDEPEDPNIVEFLDANVAFGSDLSSYAKNTASTPLRIKISEACADNRHIKLLLKAKCDNITSDMEQPIVLVANNMVEIGGVISENTTLTADQVYYVANDLAIMEGATLTIEPGTRLEFAAGKSLSSFGKLQAKGTPEKPIIFTGHAGEGPWGYINSHKPTGVLRNGSYIWTNSDQTLFTLVETNETPIQILSKRTAYRYYNPNEENSPGRTFPLYYYMKDFQDYLNTSSTNQMDIPYCKLADPSFLTPYVLKALEAFNNYIGQWPSEPDELHTKSFICEFSPEIFWKSYAYPRDTISYCKMDGGKIVGSPIRSVPPIMNDCVLEPCSGDDITTGIVTVNGERNVIQNMIETSGYGQIKPGTEDRKSYINMRFTNIVNNDYCRHTMNLPQYAKMPFNNYFNNKTTDPRYGTYMLKALSDVPSVSRAEHPSYLGTAREDLVRPYIIEFGNTGNLSETTYATVDLSNMPDRPYAEAHGIVWKVVVNGYDAQDEFEQLPPLGVGRHKFEVYFNRPMNKEVAPQISFGVREPYTQQPVAEDGSWNEEGTIYTAYKTITGKTKSDGLNRIYVYGAEDNEFFEIPYEKSRFNINIQAAGSMATGFMAEAGLGRVNLTWNNEENNFDDAMGFNIYRYNYVEKDSLDRYGKPTGVKIVVPDTIRINQEIVDVEATEYTDYEVIPGETYYYYYKVLSTDLKEYDISNVVTVTPQTSELGDANGSGDVDVADVITTVNYAAGQQPKPFIFEAADMNADLGIDILDVIGIIKKIMNPGADAQALAEATATYTIENGTLYVESPVALAGVQVQLAMDEGENEVRVAEGLNGFEHTSAWLSENDYLFLAYNMNSKTLPAGKHALLHIGNGLVAQMRLADSAGRNVEAIGDDATKINRMATDVMTVPGIYDLQGRKITNDSQWQGQLPKGVYIVNGKKVVR